MASPLSLAWLLLDNRLYRRRTGQPLLGGRRSKTSVKRVHERAGCRSAAPLPGAGQTAINSSCAAKGDQPCSSGCRCRRQLDSRAVAAGFVAAAPHRACLASGHTHVPLFSRRAWESHAAFPRVASVDSTIREAAAWSPRSVQNGYPATLPMLQARALLRSCRCVAMARTMCGTDVQGEKWWHSGDIEAIKGQRGMDTAQRMKGGALLGKAEGRAPKCSTHCGQGRAVICAQQCDVLGSVHGDAVGNYTGKGRGSQRGR